MQHLTLKATTTEVDVEQGTFVALVSGWSPDRDSDVILPTAFDKTLEAWRRTKKRLPMLFEHSPRSIGKFFPEEMFTTSEGLVAAGEVDRSTDEGRQVWARVKDNAVGFSIGGIFEDRPRWDGKGKEIYEVDLLEISATSVPAHPATRVVSWKSAAVDDWRDRPSYSYRGRSISYRQIGLKMQVDEAAEKVEAAEEAEAKAQRQAEALRPPEPALPVTDKPFFTDDGKKAQFCNAPDCSAYPTTSSGSLKPMPGRWFCEEHADLRQDDEPEELTWIPRPGSAFGVMINPKSAEGQRLKAEAERQREEERQRREAEEAEAEALRKVRERYEREASVNIAGRKVRVGNVNFR